MDLPAVLPVALIVEGRACLVVGGGESAARKVDRLFASRASVTVVAPQLCEALRDRLAVTPEMRWLARDYEPTDLDGVSLVFTTTGLPRVDAAVSRDATTRGLFANSADDPKNCSFFLTSVVRRDPVLISITTSGASPGLATYLRRRLEADLDATLGEVALVLSAVRGELHDRGASTESLDWDAVIGPTLFGLVADGRRDEAHRFVVEGLT
jgi:siroheme synthase-like protein